MGTEGLRPWTCVFFFEVSRYRPSMRPSGEIEGEQAPCKIPSREPRNLTATARSKTLSWRGGYRRCMHTQFLNGSARDLGA